MWVVIGGCTAYAYCLSIPIKYRLLHIDNPWCCWRVNVHISCSSDSHYCSAAISVLTFWYLAITNGWICVYREEVFVIVCSCWRVMQIVKCYWCWSQYRCKLGGAVQHILSKFNWALRIIDALIACFADYAYVFCVPTYDVSRYGNDPCCPIETLHGEHWLSCLRIVACIANRAGRNDW